MSVAAIESSAAAPGQSAVPPTRAESSNGPDEAFAAQLRQADSAADQSTTTRGERRSSAARPVHAKSAPRPTEGRPGHRASQTTGHEASGSATDRSGSAAGSPSGAADGSAQPLVPDASLDPTGGAVGGATNQSTGDATTGGPTTGDPTTAIAPTVGPTAAAWTASTPGDQGGTSAATGAREPASDVVAGATGPARSLGTTGRGSVLRAPGLSDLAGGRLDGRPGAHRVGVARPGDPRDAGSVENLPMISTDTPTPVDPNTGTGPSADLASALAAAVGVSADAGPATSIAAGAQSAGVPTVSAISTVAAAAPVSRLDGPDVRRPDGAQPGVAGQLAASLQSLRGREDGVHVLTVRLHPDELGPVRVVARLDRQRRAPAGHHQHGGCGRRGDRSRPSSARRAGRRGPERDRSQRRPRRRPGPAVRAGRGRVRPAGRRPPRPRPPGTRHRRRIRCPQGDPRSGSPRASGSITTTSGRPIT